MAIIVYVAGFADNAVAVFERDGTFMLPETSTLFLPAVMRP